MLSLLTVQILRYMYSATDLHMYLLSGELDFMHLLYSPNVQIYTMLQVYYRNGSGCKYLYSSRLATLLPRTRGVLIYLHPANHLTVAIYGLRLIVDFKLVIATGERKRSLRSRDNLP